MGHTQTDTHTRVQPGGRQSCIDRTRDPVTCRLGPATLGADCFLLGASSETMLGECVVLGAGSRAASSCSFASNSAMRDRIATAQAGSDIPRPLSWLSGRRRAVTTNHERERHIIPFRGGSSLKEVFFQSLPSPFYPSVPARPGGLPPGHLPALPRGREVTTPSESPNLPKVVDVLVPALVYASGRRLGVSPAIPHLGGRDASQGRSRLLRGVWE
jgi:hypothetical protein